MGNDIRVPWSSARNNRYHEIAEELGGGYGYDFHLKIMERLDAECAEVKGKADGG